MAATKLMMPLLRLAVERGECIATAKASFSTSRNFVSSSRQHVEPLPEFLLPSVRKRRIPHTIRTVRPSTLRTYSKRKFVSSPVSKAVAVTINPRKDEEGNDMLVDITSRAATVRVFIVLSGMPVN